MAEHLCHIDPYEYLKLTLNPDGSLTRGYPCPLSPPNPTYDPENPTPVLSKDITFDPSNKDAWFRIYLPRQQQLDGAKLPVVFYFHGGGFIILAPDFTGVHLLCSKMAESIPAIVVNFKYPLAPEHRLPAAYDHVMRALHWIKTNLENIDWLRDHADFSNCFLMGTSAGANMSYQLGLRVAAAPADLEPIEIRGLVLHHPGFCGVQRTPTQLRLVNDPILPLSACDLVWEMALPAGADRDHEYCNPTAGGGSKDVDKMRALGYKVLVTGNGDDPLYDHTTAVAKWLENKGMRVETLFRESGGHGFEPMGPSGGMAIDTVLRKFIIGS